MARFWYLSHRSHKEDYCLLRRTYAFLRPVETYIPRFEHKLQKLDHLAICMQVQKNTSHNGQTKYRSKKERDLVLARLRQANASYCIQFVFIHRKSVQLRTTRRTLLPNLYSKLCEPSHGCTSFLLQAWIDPEAPTTAFGPWNRLFASLNGRDFV